MAAVIHTRKQQNRPRQEQEAMRGKVGGKRRRSAAEETSNNPSLFRPQTDSLMHPLLASGEHSNKKQKCLDAGAPIDARQQMRNGRRAMCQSHEASTPSPSTKRCCKKDLQRCVRVGEILEVTRVEQHYLDAFNQGEKISGRFTGSDIFDLTQNITYRSLSKWVKKRLVDVGALGHKSNISGWDFVAVERDGRKQSLRMLVENVDSDSSSPGEGTSQSSSPSNAETVQRFFGVGNDKDTGSGFQTSIADRMRQLLRPAELSPVASCSSGTSSPESTSNAQASEKTLRSKCASLREELTQARAYVAHLETQLSMREQELESSVGKRTSTDDSPRETGYQLRSR